MSQPINKLRVTKQDLYEALLDDGCKNSKECLVAKAIARQYTPKLERVDSGGEIYFSNYDIYQLDENGQMLITVFDDKQYRKLLKMLPMTVTFRFSGNIFNIPFRL